LCKKEAQLFSMYTQYKYKSILTFIVTAISTIHLASELTLNLRLPKIQLNAGNRRFITVGKIYAHKAANGPCETVAGTVYCNEEMSKKSSARLHNVVNCCFAGVHKGSIDLRPLENFILHHSIISRRQPRSPWGTVRGVNLFQYTAEYNDNTECGLPNWSPLIRFCIQSHLDLKYHDQLAEEYISIVAEAFDTEPRINIDKMATAMDQLNPIPYAKAYRLATYYFMNERAWQQLIPYVPKRSVQTRSTQHIINVRDLFEFTCQARYCRDELGTIVIKNHGTKGSSLEKRLGIFKNSGYWREINSILNKAIHTFIQGQAPQKEVSAGKAHDGIEQDSVGQNSSKGKKRGKSLQEIPEKNSHTGSRKKPRLEYCSAVYRPDTFRFINDAVQEKLELYIPERFRRVTRSDAKILGIWHFLDVVCQSWAEGNSLSKVKINGVKASGTSLLRRYEKFTQEKFWKNIEPILRKQVEGIVPISSNDSDKSFECPSDECSSEFSEYSTEFSIYSDA
jgi:hypothetical protein